MTLIYVQIPQPKVDTEALYQKPKKQRRHQHQQQQIRVEKIEEEPEVKIGRENGDSNRVNCGAQTTPTVKASEGMSAAAAASTRQQRLAPLAEQVESAKLIETYSIDRGNFCPISPLSFIHLFRSRPTRPSLPPSECVCPRPIALLGII